MSAVTTPSVAGVCDDARLELIEEAADAAIGFVVSARQHARDGDVARLGDCVRAVWLAAQVMRKGYRELSHSCDDPKAAA
jgi:hypothetical protein